MGRHCQRIAVNFAYSDAFKERVEYFTYLAPMISRNWSKESEIRRMITLSNKLYLKFVSTFKPRMYRVLKKKLLKKNLSENPLYISVIN